MLKTKLCRREGETPRRFLAVVFATPGYTCVHIGRLLSRTFDPLRILNGSGELFLPLMVRVKFLYKDFMCVWKKVSLMKNMKYSFFFL